MTPLTTTPPPGDLPPRPDFPPLVGQAYGEPRFHTDGDIAAVAFGPDDTVWAVDEAGVLRHWAADGRLLGRTFLSDLETLWRFDPRAKLLASGNDDLLLWEVGDGQLLQRIHQTAWVTALGFSPDGRTLASGHDDGSVRFWDVGSGKGIGKIAAHPTAVSAVAFDPTGKFVATAGEDRAVRVWDADSHKPAGDLLSHTDRIPALAWSGDGKLLVSAGWDTSARVWAPPAGDPLMLLNSHAEQVTNLAFSPDGKTLATVDSDNDIHLWADPTTGEVGRVLTGHADEVRCLAFSGDGTTLATAGADRVVHLWDVATGKLLAGPNPTGKHGVAVVRAGGRLLLASSGGPCLRVWDADTGAEVWPTGGPAAYAVAAGGPWLAAGGTDHVTRVYDLTQPGSEPKTLEATKPPIGSLSVAADGRLIAHTSPADGLVWLWPPAGPEAELILIEAADGCTLEGVALHPDGVRVAVGGIDYLSTGERDGAVCVWDRATKDKLTTFDHGVYAVAVDPSGKYLAGAGLADKVYLWDLETNELVFELEGHQERINAVAFSPDGSYLVSGGDDMTVRVWDVLSGRLVVVRELDSPVLSLAFDPDGESLFTGNGNTTCYRISVNKLLDE